MDEEKAKSLLSFAEAAALELRGLDSKTTLQQLEQRYQELQDALNWFHEHQQSSVAFRLSTSLVPFWMVTKRLHEGSNWFDRLLDSPGGDDPYRGRAFFSAGYLAFWSGDYYRSATLLDRALQIGRRTNSPTVTALALVGLARLALRTDVEEARNLCREALTITEGTDDREGRSSAMHVLAVAAQMAGDLLEARQLMKTRIELAREAGNFATISAESSNLSMVERQLGNIDDAEALAAEALRINHRRGDGLAISWNLNGLAAVAALRGQIERAAILIGAADAVNESAGGAWPPDERVHYDQTVANLLQAMGQDALQRARERGHAMSGSDAVAFALAAHLVAPPPAA